MKTVAIAGHFNPLHIGHLQLIKSARTFGDRLVVIVANERQAEQKRPVSFIPEGERLALVYALKGVDSVVLSVDESPDVCETLKMVKPDVFCSGCSSDHPDANKEKIVCEELGIQFLYNIGGEKIRNSSVILEKYVNSSK